MGVKFSKHTVQPKFKNMKKIVVLLILVLSFQYTFSQDGNVEIVTHRVALGETMLMISKKYLVTPTEIYKLNKKAIDGVSEGMVLYIPQPIKSQDILAKRIEKREKEKLALLELKKEREDRELALAEVQAKEEYIDVVVVEEDKKTDFGRREEIGNLKISDKKQFIDHEVISGETLSGLSRKFGVSVEEIEKENAKTLKNGLQIGQTLKMPVAKNLFIEKPQKQVNSNSVSNEAKSLTSHKVVSGETLYSIARIYDISVSQIQSENEKLLKNGLQTGQELKITSNAVTTINSEEIVNSITVDGDSTYEYAILKHKVEPKETLYSISKKYGISIDEIKNQNESIASKGLQSGQEISIKVKK